MTDLRDRAKQIICAATTLRLPHGYSMGELTGKRADMRIDDIVPDVVVEFDDGIVAIELWIDGRVPHHMFDAFKAADLAAMAIDLTLYRYVEASDEDWKRFVLDEAQRAWLYPPAAVRREYARLAAERLDGARERERKEQDYLRKIEAMRAAAQRAANEQPSRAADLAVSSAIDAERKQQAALRKQQDERMLAAGDVKDPMAEFDQARQDWIDAAPDLQVLVAAAGGYDKITTEAWAQWYLICENWYAFVRDSGLHRRR